MPYQAELDAIVLDFYDTADKIEKRAFNTCDSIEEDNPTGAYEKIEEVLGEARLEIQKERRRLAQKLNSLNLPWDRCHHVHLASGVGM